MSYESSIKKLGQLKASTDLSGIYGRFGTVNSSGLIALTGAGLRADGVVSGGAPQDQACVFVISGIVEVEYNGSITAGDNLKSDASGKAVAHTAGTFLCAIAVESGSAGELHPVLLTQAGTES